MRRSSGARAVSTDGCSNIRLRRSPPSDRAQQGGRGCLAVAVLLAQNLSDRIARRLNAEGHGLANMVDITSVENVTPDGIEARHETSRAGMDYTPPTRTGAFRAAGRHTSRVRLLRRVIILGSVFSVSIIAVVAIFDPFRHLPGSVSIGGVGVKGSKITMETPKISGLQQGGGRYDVAADTGIQDIRRPSEIELLGVNAHIGMSDGTNTHVLSKHGLYNSDRDTMALDGDVKIANTSGYTFGLKSATVDFKRGILSSQQRMRVDLQGGFVNADGVTIANNGDQVTFRGNVSSTFDSADDSADAGPSPDVKAVTTLEAKP